MVIHGEQTEFRILQPAGKPTKIDAVLAGGTRFIVGPTGHRAEISGIGDGAESQHDLSAAFGRKVIRTKICTRRINAGAIPAEEIKSF